MENITTIQSQIREFILITSYAPSEQVANDTLLFAEGIMDSMGFISIISFIEDTFSISTADDELLDTNFESIDAIANFVFGKLNSK